jgi:hypothetical protein
MGRLYQRPSSPHYWADYTDAAGRRVRVSTGTEDREEAKRFLKLREGKVAEGAPIPPRLDRITFDELRDNLMTYYRTTGRWKHLDDAERRLAHVSKFFGGRRVVTITPDLIRYYADARQREKVPGTTRLVSPATVNRELAMLRRALRLDARAGKVLHVPAVKLLREAPARASWMRRSTGACCATCGRTSASSSRWPTRWAGGCGRKCCPSSAVTWTWRRARCGWTRTARRTGMAGSRICPRRWP